MGKVSNDPRTYLRDAVALADRVFDRPQDQDAALKLALKVQALEEALKHGSFILVPCRARRGRKA